MRGQDLSGQRFGRLTVLWPIRELGRRTRWDCICDCGNTIVVSSGYHLTSGNTQSCGCLHRELARTRQLQHGGKGTRLYNIWKNVRQRCRNPKATDFKLYGGRGITICDEWEDFGTFREWALQNGYTDELTLDRIDPNGNYCPANCRWATWAEQRHNQRRCKEVMP